MVGMNDQRAPKVALRGLTCTVDGCTEPMHAKCMCKRHYKQAHRTGEATPGVKGRHGPVAERFWHYVTKGPDEACWMWAGNTDKDGYGILRTPSSQVRAHRVSYEIHKEPIPAGRVVRHTCHTPGCVNPRHLLTGTNYDNVMDKVLAGRAPSNEDHPNCKFPNAVADVVRQSTARRKDLAREFGMSESQVSNIRTGAQRRPTGEAHDHS